jgi:hypothetical protein
MSKIIRGLEMRNSLSILCYKKTRKTGQLTVRKRLNLSKFEAFNCFRALPSIKNIFTM